ncbi:phenylacetate--CoA ligase [Dehalobacter sp. DCM]|nr:phenylacetate--CoA ligase [Dehalobacter sp. DCM]
MGEEKLLPRLQKTVKLALNVSYHRERLKNVGITSAEDVQTLEDFARIPLTSKEDLRQNYPFGLIAVPMEEIVELHASSGTTGKPIVAGYTKNDVALWGKIVAKGLQRIGVTKDDVIQVSYGYGLFTGGIGLHYGGLELGAVTVPMSGGNTQRQLMLMQDFGATVLACTPSYALYLGDSLAEAGIKLSDIKLRKGVFGAEPWTPQMRKEIEERLGIEAFDIYGLTESMGPGVALDCHEHSGLHIDEHFYPEILDDNGNILPLGEKGSLVLTSIDKEGFPGLRYHTKDLTRLRYGRCSCGFEGWTMDKVSARVDDMLIIRGVNVFPSQIEEAILSVEGVIPHYLINVERVESLDVLEVWVEVNDQSFLEDIRELESLKERLQNRIQNIINIAVRVKLVEPKSIPRSEGKAKRVIDKRKG